jgi:hypothetical protein
MIFKVTFDDKTHRFEINSDVYNKYEESFLAEFEEQLVSKLTKIATGYSFPLEYIDEDGDRVTIETGNKLAYHIENVWIENDMKKVFIYL